MITHIAHFTAKHKVIQLEQNSIFTWRQDSGDIDYELLENKIRRESAIHFFKLVAGKNYPLDIEDLQINIVQAVTFNGY